jgi:nucleoside-diphosphate-sugar epimerase
MKNVGQALITGAQGFVGSVLCKHLATSGWQIRCAVRHRRVTADIEVGEIGPQTDWRKAVEGIDCVVHLAARTHILSKDTRNALLAYRRINVSGTVALARIAASHGVRRLVFLSSIKVNGERTPDRPFTEDRAPQPEDAYGISKYEAEHALAEISAETGIEVVILRPPLVYGPGVKANFLRLMHLAAREMPLPFAAIENRRSLIYLGNLVDAISVCMEHPAASGNTYLVSDRETVGTAELVREIATALRVEPKLYRVPVPLLDLGAALFGRRAEWNRLSTSLQVDASKIRAELGWRPPFTMAQGLSETAQWYHSRFSAKSTS